MAINLTTKVAPYTDEVFAKESKKSLLTNSDFDWVGAHTIKVYKISTVGMNDYNRSGADDNNWSRYGAVAGLDATTEEMTLKKDRSFTYKGIYKRGRSLRKHRLNAYHKGRTHKARKR
jgi:hypothetical protein